MTKGERAFASTLLSMGIAAIAASVVAIAIIGVASLLGLSLAYFKQPFSWDQAWILLGREPISRVPKATSI